MKTKTVKSFKEIKLNGISVDGEIRDGSLKAVTLTDRSGNFVTFNDSNSYGSMIAAVPEPPKMVKRLRLTGTVKGLKVDELFESDFKAGLRHDELAALDARDLKLEPVEVPEDDAAPTTADESPLPF